MFILFIYYYTTYINNNMHYIMLFKLYLKLRISVPIKLKFLSNKLLKL